jgi:hypothetical protein
MNTDATAAPGTDLQWRRDISELLAWLEGQKGGTGTFFEFQQRSIELCRANLKHAALLRLLGNISGQFADQFDGMPLEVSVASRALEVLTGFVREAQSVPSGNSDKVLDLLNRIAVAELARG